MSNESFAALYASRIKELRSKLQSVNLGDLEGVAGVSRATLFRVRQGRHQPEPETIDAIWAGIRRLEDTEAP